MKKNKTLSRMICIIFSVALVLAAGFFAQSVQCHADGGAESMDYDAALEYMDGYAENVVEDADFDTNFSSALVAIRDNVGTYATFWALVPPIIAIALALITKEVYSSLFVGIFAGALIYSGFNVWGAVTKTFDTMIGSLADSWNVGILIFLVLLGIIVCLMNKAGGSAAYGKWAAEHIKTRVGAILATWLLGVLIFVDDYFNCLTVGSVMLPVTDKHKVSRAKLAYIIDATAAPVCIIAPISSWAAAVSSVAPEGEGITMFCKSIPYNFYALLTLLMLVTITLMKFDFGPMKKHEDSAAAGDLFNGIYGDYKDEETAKTNGKVIDLILPVVVLIISCVLCMVYTGGFFDGASFMDAFSDSDASVGLSLGAFIALVFTFCFYIFRKILTFDEFMKCIPEGFKAMVPAILILTFAWTLSGVTGALGAKIFVANLVHGSAAAFQNMLPAIIFLIAIGLSFATGTSWGTFGILLPIVVSVGLSPEVASLAVGACLAGAVCGDHCSPISDTTIMASTGARCNHVAHVSTQLPYAMLVAAVSFVSYILGGFVQNVWITLPIAIVLMLGTLFVMKMAGSRKAK